MADPKILFTKKKMQQLQTAYDKAVAAGKDQFTFEGQALLCAYAKYLLEYLKQQFNEA